MAVYWSLLNRSHNQMQEQVRADTQQMAGHTAKALALQMTTAVSKLDYFSNHLGWLWLKGNELAFDEATAAAMDTLPFSTLVQVAVADAQGRVRYTRGVNADAVIDPQPPVFITDREHFTVHAHCAGTTDFFISSPVKGRISQQWTIQFTRGLWLDGTFQGVIILSVSAEYLATALKAIFPDQTDAASLVNNQGTYLARSYHLSQVLGKTLPHDRPFIQHPELNRGTYEVVADVDQIARLYSWERVPHFPLIILVGLDSDKALALTSEAISDSHWQSGLGSGLLLLAGLTVAWLWAQRSRRSAKLQHIAEQLQASKAQLRITLDAVRDGLWTFDHTTMTAKWDNRIRAMLGYGENHQNPSVQTLEALIHPADLPPLRLEGARAFNSHSDQVINMEFRLRNASGRWLWVLARGRAVEWNSAGLPKKSVGTLTDISARVSEGHLRHALLNRSAAAILLVNPERRIVDANARFASMFLRPGQHLKDLDLRDVHLDNDHWDGLGVSYATLRETGKLHMEYPFKNANGQVRWYDIHAVLQDPDDPQSNTIWTWIDITSRHEADAALALETLRLNTLLECFPGGVLIEDANESVIFVNPVWPRLLGLEVPASALQGMHDIELRTHLGPTMSGWMRSHQPGRSPESRQSHEVTTAQGQHLEINHIEIRQNKQYLGSVWLLRDITERKQHELELAHLASTDVLTALPNRRSFMQHLNAACADVSSACQGTVLMLDIDHFKKVNDTYGHAIGDVVLQHIARAIKAILRTYDIPGRLGGEEFAVLLPATGTREGVKIAERIRQSIADSTIKADPHQIRVTISIGIAGITPTASPDDVLQQADDALYAAKESGRNRVCEWVAAETRQDDPATT